MGRRVAYKNIFLKNSSVWLLGLFHLQTTETKIDLTNKKLKQRWFIRSCNFCSGSIPEDKLDYQDWVWLSSFPGMWTHSDV